MIQRRGKVPLLLLLGGVILLIGVPLWITRRQIQQESLNNALLSAIKRSEVTSVLSLLAQGADPNARELPVSRRTLWQILSERWQGKPSLPNTAPSALLLAVDQRSNVNHFLPETTTIVEALLRKGADVNSRTETGETALVTLFENRHIPGTRSLAMWPQENPALVALLLKYGADTEARVMNGETALISAAGRGYMRSVRLLLDKGANPNAVSKGCPGTALSNAVLMEHKAVMRLLLERGADVNLRDGGGVTAMDFASRSKRTDFIALLKQASIRK
jgi:uncharacterized protein